MSNVLPDEKRLLVLRALLDGNSERAVARIAEVGRATVSRFALSLGRGAERLHDRLVCGLRAPLVQADEMFAFVQKKAACVTPGDPPDVGEAYIFAGMDTASRASPVAPEPPPGASPVAAIPRPRSPVKLDLFAWRPRPATTPAPIVPPRGQLDLFPEK